MEAQYPAEHSTQLITVGKRGKKRTRRGGVNMAVEENAEFAAPHN